MQYSDYKMLTVGLRKPGASGCDILPPLFMRRSGLSSEFETRPMGISIDDDESVRGDNCDLLLGVGVEGVNTSGVEVDAGTGGGGAGVGESVG